MEKNAKPLAAMTVPELRRVFGEAFGAKPSVAARREFLAGNLEYRRQVEAHGGLAAGTVRALHAIAKGQKARLHSKPEILPGTRLVRMWQGKPHEVTVLDGRRFMYRDKEYPSLSAVANLVSGSKWNGNIFFGIKKDPRRVR